MLEGTLTFTGARDGDIVPIADAGPGQIVVVPPGTRHGTVNNTPQPARFTVMGRPGVMSAYFREASVQVGSMTQAPATQPPGPSDLKRIAEEHDIVLWPGRGDRPLLHALGEHRRRGQGLLAAVSHSGCHVLRR